MELLAKFYRRILCNTPSFLAAGETLLGADGLSEDADAESVIYADVSGSFDAGGTAGHHALCAR